jgi:DNA-binding LacI/PurR family transcriptional regulator
VGVVIPDLQNPFFTRIVAGIEEVLHEQGYSLFLANSDSDASREQAELRMLRSERVCGVLMIPCESEASSYEDLAEGQLPLVIMDRLPEGLQADSVTVSNKQGVFEAVSHLLKAGYTSIGLVNGPDEIGVARQRAEGFRQALEEAGIHCRDEWVDTGDFRTESGYASTMKVLGNTNRPRALFVGNFLMTLGALRAVQELKLRVPEDVALLSFDDMPWAEAMNPPLSTVAQPAREIGRQAATLLLKRINDPKRPKCAIELDTQLIIRQSCGTH